MIPLSVSLKNFMSYGDPPVVVSFDGLHVACLAGDNGNGKSAILDAITWALWGKTRASSTRSVSEDDIIRLGTDEVEVCVQFELNAERYRVVRKRKRGKASGTEWKLAQLTPAGEWRSMGGANRRETSRQIVELLRMEYDTFLNSAYLQQGRADEFTRQTPDVRKRVLSEILGLDRYDWLEERARDRHREAKERSDELQRELKLLEAQIAEAPRHQEELDRTQADLASAEEQRQAQEETAIRLRDRLSKLQALAERVKQAQLERERMALEQRQREAERAAQEEEIARLRAVLQQGEAIRSDFRRLTEALQRRDVLEPMVADFNHATAELRSAVGAIELAKKELENQINLSRERLANAELRERERAGWEAERAALQAECARDGAVEENLEAARVRRDQLQQEFAGQVARNKELAAALDDLTDVLDLLARPRAVCPVCESDLSGPRQAATIARQEAKKAALEDQIRELKRVGRCTREALSGAESALAEAAAARDAALNRRRRLEDLCSRLARQEAGEDAPELRAALQRTEAKLARGDYAGPARAQRQRWEQELKRLGLAKSEYDAVKEQIGRLEPARKRQQDLEHAESAWEKEQEKLKRLELLLAEKESALEAAAQSLEQLRSGLTQHGKAAEETAAAEQETRRLQARVNSLAVEQGRLQNALQACRRAEGERKEKDQLQRAADEKRRVYQALVTAFGKRGVQALIIENAIPELEEAANQLLARLTDNAMHVRFETTRAARATGAEIETLDIKITDDSGTRPYELFSGGEAFRINFAIRIALSGLLARRAGASLQTLILDEGFGSQDGKGREKLLEAIEVVKSDFQKILVITHVEEMKDAFTQRLEVVKDETGSHVLLL